MSSVANMPIYDLMLLMSHLQVSSDEPKAMRSIEKLNSQMEFQMCKFLESSLSQRAV